MQEYSIAFPKSKGSYFQGTLKFISHTVRYTPNHIGNEQRIVTDPFKVSWANFPNNVARIDVVEGKGKDAFTWANIPVNGLVFGQAEVHPLLYADRPSKKIRFIGYGSGKKPMFLTEPYEIKKEAIYPSAFFADETDAERYRFEATINEVTTLDPANGLMGHMMPIQIKIKVITAPEGTEELSFMLLEDPSFNWKMARFVPSGNPVVYPFCGHICGGTYNMIGMKKRNSLALKAVISAWGKGEILNEIPFAIPLKSVGKTEETSFSVGISSSRGHRIDISESQKHLR